MARVTQRWGTAVLVALALVFMGAGCSDEPESVRIELSETEVRAGQMLELRVLASGEHYYGVDAVLERLTGDGEWTQAYYLRLSEDAAGTGFARYGDESWLNPLVARSGDRWWVIALPGGLQAGRYRIAMEMTLGANKTQSVVRSEEFSVSE